jgi:hypothetical protein
MIRAAFILQLAVVLAACGWDDSPREESAASGPERGRSQIHATAQKPKQDTEQQRREAARRAMREEAREREAEAARAKLDAEREAERLKREQEKAEADKPKRDYGAELERTMRGAESCLQPRLAKDAPDKLSISLEAVVLDSGRITRGYVRSGQLQAGELECLEQRLRAARLPDGVEQSPRTVRGTLDLQLKKPEKAAP